MAAEQLDTVLQHLRRLVREQPAGEQTDRQLLEQFIRRRDEAAFAALVERHGRLVLGVCRSVLGQEQDVEDAFQATFLVLASKAASIRQDASLSSFLHGVARRTALKARQGMAARRRRERQAGPRPPEQPVTEAALRELQAILHEEVARLPEKYRAPFVHCCLEGKSRAEAASLLGWKEGTVSGRLARARERLRQRLAVRGIGLPAALCASTLAPATVGPALAAAASRAALAVGTGTQAAVSARAAALAEGVTRAMSATRLKAAVSVLAAVVLVAAGAGVLAYPAPDPRPPEAAAGDEPRLVAPRVARPGPVPAADAAQVGPGDRRPVPPLVPMTIRGAWQTMRGHPRQAVALSPDGKTLASFEAVNGLRIYLWDTATGKLLRQCLLDKEATRLAFSPDGKLLYSGRGDFNMYSPGLHPPETSLRVWDVATGRQTRALSADLWDLSRDGKTLAVMTVHQLLDPGFGVMGKGGKNYSNPSFTVTFWDTARWKQVGHFTKKGRSPGVIRLSPDGRVLACGDTVDGSICFWDAATGKAARTLPGTRDKNTILCVQLLDFSPDGKALAVVVEPIYLATGVRVIALWDWRTGKLLRRLADPATKIRGEPVAYPDPSPGIVFPITGMAFTPDGKRIVSCGYDGRCRFWDVGSGRPAGGVAVKDSDRILGMALSGDGKTLALAGAFPRQLLRPRVFDLPVGKERLTPCERFAAAPKLPFEPDGPFPDPYAVTAARRVALGDRALELLPKENVVRLVGAGGKELRRYRWGRIFEFACSPDGHTLATRGWGLEGGDEAMRMWSPDPAIRLWDVDTGKQWGVIATKPPPSFTFRFSPDGRTLAVVHDDGTIRLWELASGGQRLALDCLGLQPIPNTLLDLNTIRAEPLAHLAFSRDGRFLAAADKGKKLTLLWDLTGLSGKARPALRLGPRQQEQLWRDLQGDAESAYRALWSLSAAPEGVLLLEKKLPALPRLDPRPLGQLIAELDSDEFAERERATERLAALGRGAEPAMRKALADRPTLEVRRRLEALLQKVRTGPAVPSAQVTALRVVEVLEHSGTPRARRVLQALAAEKVLPFAAPAREALGRLDKRARK